MSTSSATRPAIAFLGTGRMGTELALHLVADHPVAVWNRSAERAAGVVAAGATLASTVGEAVAGKTVVVSCLFGPDTVREVVIGSGALPAGALWIDATTVSPADAAEFAGWAAEHGVRYVHTPVVGSIGPARKGMLGVYVGGASPTDRDEAKAIVRPWADPDRLRRARQGCAADPEFDSRSDACRHRGSRILDPRPTERAGCVRLLCRHPGLRPSR